MRAQASRNRELEDELARYRSRSPNRTQDIGDLTNGELGYPGETDMTGLILADLAGSDMAFPGDVKAITMNGAQTHMETSPPSAEDEDEDEHVEHGEEEVRGRGTTRSVGRTRFAGAGAGVEVSVSKSAASESEERAMED